MRRHYKLDEVVVPSQEDIDNEQTLLASHRRTLAHYLRQQALLGTARTPPEVTHGIHESRQAIQRIKTVLRSWHVAVDDLPDDEKEVGLAIFCLNHLSNLPEMIIDTVFRVYSKTTSQSGSFYNDLVAEHEKGRQKYPRLYTDAGLKEAQRMGLENIRAIYIGSPVYTAIG